MLVAKRWNVLLFSFAAAPQQHKKNLPPCWSNADCCFQLTGGGFYVPLPSTAIFPAFSLMCFVSSLTYVFSVQIHYTATHYSIKLEPEYNHTGNEWGQKPTVYVKDGLYTDRILMYELPTWLMQKEKGSAAHPLEAVMNKCLQTIVFVSAFVHSLLLMFPLVKKNHHFYSTFCGFFSPS